MPVPILALSISPVPHSPPTIFFFFPNFLFQNLKFFILVFLVNYVCTEYLHVANLVYFPSSLPYLPILVIFLFCKLQYVRYAATLLYPISMGCALPPASPNPFWGPYFCLNSCSYSIFTFSPGGPHSYPVGAGKKKLSFAYFGVCSQM